MSLIKSFSFDHKKLSVYGTVDEPLFLAKEVGQFLNIKNIRDNLLSIPDDWKVVGETDTLGGKQNMIYLKEPALYKIAFRSNKEEADKFTNWVASEVLPAIRKTGEYKAPERTQCRQQLTFKIETEQDLHYKTVNFLRNLKQYDLVLIAGGGELQDSKNKRIDQYNKGYSRGQPDLIIANPNKNYSGFCIEFKSPTGKGTVSKYQYDMLDKYKKIGYKTMISNSYDDILSAIVDYLFDLRIVCQYCPRKFKNKDTLENHCKYFHKITK